MTRGQLNSAKRTVDRYGMVEVHSQSAAERAEQEILELLKEVDALSAALDTGWAEKRNRARRKFQTGCAVYHPIPEGTALLENPASTRDISEGGLGFVSPLHYQRNTALLVIVTLPQGNVRRLLGRTVYSRRVRDGWFLTGVKFGPVDDEMLLQAARQEDLNTLAAVRPADGPAADPDRRNAPEPGGARERALAALAAAGASRNLSREATAKVITLSMSPDYVVRRATIPVLMQITSGEGALALIQLLDDANPAVQAEAVDALGRLRAARAIEPLRHLLRHTDQALGLRAAEALGRMDDESGIPLAARLVRSDSPINRRAARTLGVIVKLPFRATADGVAAARGYLKANRIK